MLLATISIDTLTLRLRELSLLVRHSTEQFTENVADARVRKGGRANVSSSTGAVGGFIFLAALGSKPLSAEQQGSQ